MPIGVSATSRPPPIAPSTIAETIWATTHDPMNVTTAVDASIVAGLADGRIALRIAGD